MGLISSQRGCSGEGKQRLKQGIRHLTWLLGTIRCEIGLQQHHRPGSKNAFHSLSNYGARLDQMDGVFLWDSGLWNHTRGCKALSKHIKTTDGIEIITGNLKASFSYSETRWRVCRGTSNYQGEKVHITWVLQSHPIIFCYFLTLAVCAFRTTFSCTSDRLINHSLNLTPGHLSFRSSSAVWMLLMMRAEDRAMFQLWPECVRVIWCPRFDPECGSFQPRSWNEISAAGRIWCQSGASTRWKRAGKMFLASVALLLPSDI